MCKVHNKYHQTAPPDAIYIGRGSMFGNPYIIGVNGNRNEVCDKFEKMILKNKKLIKQIKNKLKGKDLVCYCAPKRCHGDFLVKLANEK